MASNEESGSPGWSASFFMQTTEDIARAVATAAAAATAAHSARPSVVFSAKDDSSSQLQKLQRQVTKVLKGFSAPPEVKSVTYNPEVLTSQKRLWASCQLQYLVYSFVISHSFFLLLFINLIWISSCFDSSIVSAHCERNWPF